MDPLTLALLGLGGLGSVFGFASGRSAQSDATAAMMDAIAKAMAEIQAGKKETMGFLEPYLKNAPADYNRYRNLVQSGYFGQGAPTSFQAQDFTFDPSQGSASFQTNSFAPLALPPMPQAPGPAAQPDPMRLAVTPPANWGQPIPPTQIAQLGEKVGIGHPFNIAPPGTQFTPDVSPNAWVGPAGTIGGNPAAGMPKKMHEFLSMLGILGPAFRGGGMNPNGIPGGSGPNIPLSPRPGGDFGGIRNLPGRTVRRY